MSEIELHGYLTTGKFHVNDYTIEIKRIDDGMQMTITDGNTGTAQTVSISDGKPGMTDEEADAIRKLLAEMQISNGKWQDAEDARAAAEKLREIAENGEDGETDPTKYRTGLYTAMLALYNSFGDYDDARAGAAASATAAAESATQAAASAAQASEIALGSFEDILYYKNGDTITFLNEYYSSTTETEASTENDELCASGYVTGASKTIRFKIPLAKRLDNITSVTVNRFYANIANNGGYGAQKQYKDHKGYDYTNLITKTAVDKQQNCLHFTIERSTAFNLTNNDAISVRCGDVSLTLNAESTT